MADGSRNKPLTMASLMAPVPTNPMLFATIGLLRHTQRTERDIGRVVPTHHVDEIVLELARARVGKLIGEYHQESLLASVTAGWLELRG
jgi:hypothetical protein